MKRIKLVQKQAPGDLILMSGAIRDLHLSYPDQYKVYMFSYYPEIFYNNEYIEKEFEECDLEIDLYYADYLNDMRKKGFHFSDIFGKILNEKLSINIKKTTERGYLKLTEEEKSNKILEKHKIKKPFWIINAGVKPDIPLKGYPPFLWNKVVSLLRDEITFVQVGHSHHIHPTLDGVIDLVGKTDELRDFISLMYHCHGAVGHVTMQMHIAAALKKRYVAVAGGREESSWVKYSDQAFLDTIGKLDCCKELGCWKYQIQECVNLNNYPKCYKLIRPEQIVEKINYLKEKHNADL